MYPTRQGAEDLAPREKGAALALFPTPTTAGHGISHLAFFEGLGLLRWPSLSFPTIAEPFPTSLAAMSMLCSDGEARLMNDDNDFGARMERLRNAG